MPADRVRGHDAVLALFRRAHARGRLGHAYLFAGPAGVGKRLFARELAKALLCETPAGELAACDACPACALVDAGTHPDLFELARPEEAHAFPISLIRELCTGESDRDDKKAPYLAGNLTLKPARGGYKIAVIDDADDFNEESANAFLKTLEEPPPQSLIVLIATSPERQLPTILSRCQPVRFAPLPDELVDQVLLDHGVEEADRRERLVRLAAGSPGHALAMDDPDLWAFWEGFRTGLSQPEPRTVELADKLLEFVNAAGKEGAAKRKRSALVVRLVIDWLRQALAASVGGPADAAARAVGERLGPDRLLALVERCLEADRQIDRKVQLDLILEAFTDAFV